MRTKGKKSRYRVFPIERIVYNRTAYPCKVAAYLMAEAALKPYGKSVVSVICNIVNNINNFSSVIAASVLGDLFFAVSVGYRADLFSAGAEGAEKTFYGGACYCRGKGKRRRREGRGGNSELLANRAVFFDEVSLFLLGQ